MPIVEAVGAASVAMPGADRSVSRDVQAAMTQAIQHAYEAGVTDPEEIRRRMLVARERVKAERK
jgi:hypothetical protein